MINDAAAVSAIPSDAPKNVAAAPNTMDPTERMPWSRLNTLITRPMRVRGASIWMITRLIVRKHTWPAPTRVKSATESQKIGEKQKRMRKIGVVVVMTQSSMARFQRSPTEARKLSDAMPPNPGAANNMPSPLGPTCKDIFGEDREKTLVGDDKHGEGVGGDDAAQDQRLMPDIVKAFLELAQEVFFPLYRWFLIRVNK